MTKLKLVIGSKIFSSWSLRPWLVLKYFQIPFEETLIALDKPDTQEKILNVTPSGRVPVLIDGDIKVWDSLAIIEYLADSHPEVWPAAKGARARARSLTAEMHSGFAAMRTHLSCKFLQKSLTYESTPEVEADIKRIQQIWRDCLSSTLNDKAGPFLFGRFSAVDAFYAPVVSRFVVYGVKVDSTVQAYMDTILGLKVFQEWLEGARKDV